MIFSVSAPAPSLGSSARLRSWSSGRHNVNEPYSINYIRSGIETPKPGHLGLNQIDNWGRTPHASQGITTSYS